MQTLKDIVAEYNAIAAQIEGERTVNRFPDRKSAERRLQALKVKLPHVLDPPLPQKWHSLHARNEAAKSRDKLAVMNEVLAALRAAAEPSGKVDVRKVRLTGFREVPTQIFSGHIRALSMRGLYTKGKVAMRGNGKYRAPVAVDEDED